MPKILITGSSTGIGLATSLELLQQGHQVIGIARNNPKILHKEKNYTHFNLDLKSLDNLDLSEISHNHADINVIILNAGFGNFKELDQFSTKEIIELINVNLTSQILITKKLLANLRKQKNAKIIIIGSEAGLSGSKKSTIYSASKFALRGFAQSLQQDLSSSKIQVNLLNPGAIKSEFYTELNFTPGDKPENSIEISQITNLIKHIIAEKNNFYFEEINLKPIQRVFSKKRELD